MNTLLILTQVSAGLALVALLALHIVSPEFMPSWRMISEYALGKFKWLITSYFLLWGTASFFLSWYLWNEVTTVWARIGVCLLLVSAVGEWMGGLFDVKHKLHGLAFALGVPAVPVAALLISNNLVSIEPWNTTPFLILFISHATWFSVVVMGVSMGVMMAGFKKAGIPMDPTSAPPERVPEGVIALAGYANRLLVLCYVGWLLMISGVAL